MIRVVTTSYGHLLETFDSFEKIRFLDFDHFNTLLISLKLHKEYYSNSPEEGKIVISSGLARDMLLFKHRIGLMWDEKDVALYNILEPKNQLDINEANVECPNCGCMLVRRK